MSKNVNQVIDSVSASQLIKALSTLQQLSQRPGQLQVSFCKFDMGQNKSNIAHSKNVDFETFMAGKNNLQNNYNKPKRKSISPLKQYQQDNTPSKASNFKSRSHSPFQKRSERTDSRITKYSKATTTKYSQKQNNKKEELAKKDQKYPSFESKKILEQKQRLGSNYVPIQKRAEGLLKQKQVKLAKLQKQKELSRIMEEKECTFRPTIIKNYRKPPQVQKDYSQQKVTQEQINRFDQCFIDQQYLCTPTRTFIKEYQQNFQQQLFPKKSKQVNQNNETKAVIKKYKNQKFNCLLDLIH